MKAKLITLSFILLSVACFAQGASTAYHALVLKWNPLTLIGYSSVQIGGEYFLNRRNSLQLECGLITPLFEKAAISSENNQGYRVKLQYRRYFEKWFVGPEFHFVSVQYHASKSFAQNFVTDSNGITQPVDEESYNLSISKRSVSLNLTSGIQFLESRTIGIEFYWGIGVRYESTDFSGAPADRELVPYVGHITPLSFDNDEGDRFLFNVVAGLHIDFKIAGNRHPRIKESHDDFQHPFN